MKSTPARVAALLALALLASLGLLACGGSGSSSSAPPASPANASTVAETGAGEAPAEEPRGGEEAGEAAGAGSGGLTPPGTELEPGRPATVGWVPPGSFDPSKAQAGIELEVSVEAIEEGSTGDLENIELEPDEQGSVPFYVRLKLVAPTGKATPGDEDPALSFAAIDDRDQEQGSVTFLGSFPPCEETTPPKPFDDGATYETCLTYLMKGGGSIQKVQWNDGPAKANAVSEYFEKPIVWSAAGK